MEYYDLCTEFYVQMCICPCYTICKNVTPTFTNYIKEHKNYIFGCSYTRLSDLHRNHNYYSVQTGFLPFSGDTLLCNFNFFHFWCYIFAFLCKEASRGKRKYVITYSYTVRVYWFLLKVITCSSAGCVVFYCFFTLSLSSFCPNRIVPGTSAVIILPYNKANIYRFSCRIYCVRRLLLQPGLGLDESM